MQVWARLGVHEAQKLGCGANGLQWLYTTTFGEMFVTCHIVQIIMQAVMLEKALFKVPHEHGLFEAPENAEFSDESDDEHCHAGKDDDGFKVV